MNNELFRKESIERVSSPDQLNDYIKVVTPGVWMTVLAIVILVTGILAWGSFGHVETTLVVGTINDGDKMICYVSESEIETVKEDMTVIINDEEYFIEEISIQPVMVDESFSGYLLHLGGLSEGEWVYELILDRTSGVDGGIYEGKIITESIAPVRFALN